jgi:hypothetical protein
MGSDGTGMIGRLQALRARPVVAAILVTVLSLAIIGGVLLTTTSLGCGPAQKLGLKGILSHCKVSGSTVATITSPSPFPSPYSPPPSAPYSPPASAPYSPPASGPVPPDNGGPASGSYPPFNPPASSGGQNNPSFPLNCRLPVYAGPPGSGGFVVYPGGTFIADPTSAVTLPTPSSGASPYPGGGYGPGYGPGYTGLTYDRAFSRWLPVSYTAVSPDGSRYAFSATDGIYVVNVATGVETELGEGHPWNIAGVEAEGVYTTIPNQAGLWLLPYSGQAKQITTAGFWTLASSGAAYGMSTSAVPQGVPNTIIRVDLKTGTVTDWFTRQGGQGTVVGFDAHGNPLILVNYFVNQGGNDVWIVTGPDTSTPIFGSTEQLSTSGTPVADSHGIWFPMYFNTFGFSGPGLALYVPGQGLYWMSSVGAQLGGGCA